MFAKVDNGVTKSCQSFSPERHRKNAQYIAGLMFSTYLSRIACCAREPRVDIGVTDSPTKTAN